MEDEKMRIDYSNGAQTVAVIEMNNDEYVFKAQNEEEIADFLYEKVGEQLHGITEVPLFIEASSWCALACVGEVYETENFKIYIEDIEE